MGVVCSQLSGKSWELFCLLWPAQQILLGLAQALVQLSECHPLPGNWVPGAERMERYIGIIVPLYKKLK